MRRHGRDYIFSLPSGKGEIEKTQEILWFRLEVFAWRKNAASVVEAMVFPWAKTSS